MTKATPGRTPPFVKIGGRGSFYRRLPANPGVQAQHRDPTRSGGLSTSYPDGVVKKESSHSDVRNPQLRPIMMSYRAKNPKFRAYDIEQFTIVGGNSIIRGRKCVEIERRNSLANNSFVIRCWVDPLRDFLIVREMMVSNGAVRLRIDIEYESHPVAGWQPQSWKIVRNYRGQSDKMQDSTKATLATCDINTRIDSKEFDLTYLKRTYVVDLATNEWYIVRPDGGKRVVKMDERGKTYEELVGEWKNQQSSAVSNSSRWVMFAMSGILGLLAGVAWLRYRRRRVVVGS